MSEFGDAAQSFAAQQELWNSVARMAMHQAWDKSRAVNASIRVAPRGVIVTKAYKPGALELVAFSTTVVMYLDGKKQPNVVEMFSKIPLNGKSYAVDIDR